MPELPTTSEAEDPIRDSPDWAVGDFALISSDGWRYRVRSVVLCGASTVLSDAIEACSSSSSEREIRFTDLDIETSDVLPLFLSLVVHGSLAGWVNSLKSCEAQCAAVAFMRKYECACPLGMLKLHVTNQLLLGRMSPFFAFMVAAAMDDVELSILAFEKRNPHPLLAAGDVLLGASAVLPGVDTALLGAILALTPHGGHSGPWPFALWRRIPAEYLWAAQTAWTKVWAAQVAVDRNHSKPAASKEEARAERRRSISLAVADSMKPQTPELRLREGLIDVLPRSPQGVAKLDIAREYEVAIKSVKSPSASSN